MRRWLALQVPGFSSVDLGELTFERFESKNSNARWDFIIHDANGRPVAQGRELLTGEMAFWPK